MHLLYIRMTRKEIYPGLGWLAVLLLSGFLFPADSSARSAFFFQGAHFLAAMLIFHRFLRSSLEVPLTPFSRILKSALLGLILAQLANLLTNDLLYYFFPKYFGYGETGPYFVNISKELTKALLEEQFFLTAVRITLFVPIAEELFHRGLVFGNLVQRNTVLAYTASVLLYAFLPIIPLLGHYSPDYIVISFIQYLPIGILFSWIYTRTETILTPILAHILMNGVSIFTMR